MPNSIAGGQGGLRNISGSALIRLESFGFKIIRLN